MDAETLATEYLEMKRQAAALEAAMKVKREEVAAALKGLVDNPGEAFETERVYAVLVKGRETKKLDRRELVKLGVSGAVLDAATKVTMGRPYLQITEAKKHE